MQKKIRTFFVATHNLLLFLFHFFSVSALLKSLFEPWKNIQMDEQDQDQGHSWLDRLTFNAISRGLGFTLRSSLIIAFLIVATLYFIALPVATLIFFLLLSILQLESLIPPSEEALKQSYFDSFMHNHANAHNRDSVKRWFDFYYEHFLKKREWWSLTELLKIQPLGYDWTSGFTIHLNQFGDDMLSARPYLIGREEELAELTRSLMKERGANVVLIGEDGAGKHSVIYELAKRSQEGTAAKQLAYKRFIQLDIEKVLARYQTPEQQETFFAELLREGERAKNIVLVIDNLGKYLSNDAAGVNLSSSIQKCAEHSSIHLIVSTTPHDYEKYFRPQASLQTLFSPLEINEPTPEENTLIVAQKALTFEQRYSCIIPYEMIEQCIEKSDYYLSQLPFPQKALNLLEDACTVAAQQKASTLTLSHLQAAISKETKAPTEIDDTLKDKLLTLEPQLQRIILHQDQALQTLAAGLRRAFVMLGKRKKPLATLLFTGPTGTGKTATAKAVTKIIFEHAEGTDSHLLRFDMAEYQQPETIAQLIGGRDDVRPGLLTEAVERTPFATLLLDEIEKAHHDLLNIFLTILDEGYFVSGSGRRVDCKHLIIIATSNVLRVEETFSPEFLNRFDGIVPFQTLEKNNVLEIARKQVKDITDNYQSLHHITVQVSDATIATLIDKHYRPEYGVRDIQRILATHIEDVVSKNILSQKLSAGGSITL